MTRATKRPSRHRLLKAILGALIAYLVTDGLRSRRRLGALATLTPSDEPVAPEHRFLTAEGVAVDEATRRAASAHARREGLEVVDLVPADLPTEEALELAALVDPATFRAARLAPGRGAFRALLATADVLDRAEIDAVDDLDPVAVAAATIELKRFAPVGCDLAVAPGLTVRPVDLDKRLAFIRSMFNAATPAVVAMPVLQWAAIGAGLALAPPWGLAALGAYCAQPLLALSGSPLHPRDLGRGAGLRIALEPMRWLRTVTGGWSPPPEPDPVESRRPWYDEQLAGGLDRFFEERRPDCPLCGSTDLSVRLRTTDVLQHKPGEFTLEQCGGCGVIFQNPRLSVEGLDFYYRDFYDGLGEEFTEFIFGATDRSYLGRAEMMAGRAEPERWLDVGAGHGHFCLVARDQWPDTRFDGLDLSDSIDEAARRGWVDHGYRGLFPELATDMADTYDVVSMHHYLEHTREPLDELDAAAVALHPGGHLLIELPDPESVFGRLVGRWWIPWFQPQHQHLLPIANLEEALVGRGFEVVARDRSAAHQTVDMVIAVWLWLNSLVPADAPWVPRGSPFNPVLRVLVVAAGAPLLALAAVADQVANVVMKRRNLGNTYRVLARFPEAPDAPAG